MKRDRPELRQEIAKEMIKRIRVLAHPGIPNRAGAVPGDSVCKRMTDMDAGTKG